MKNPNQINATAQRTRRNAGKKFFAKISAVLCALGLSALIPAQAQTTSGGGSLAGALAWAQITNTPATNISSTGTGGLTLNLTPTNRILAGTQSALNLRYSRAGSDFMQFGLDNESEGTGGWAGQITIWGAPANDGSASYYNVAGINIANANLRMKNRIDPRTFAFRFKDPSPHSDGTWGGYFLMENRYLPSAPDSVNESTYANFLMCDNNGNVGIGDLGARADDDQAGDLHPSGKVTVYGSRSRSYPYLDVVQDFAHTNTSVFQIDASGVVHGNGSGLTNLITFSQPWGIGGPASALAASPAYWMYFGGNQSGSGTECVTRWNITDTAPILGLASYFDVSSPAVGVGTNSYSVLWTNGVSTLWTNCLLGNSSVNTSYGTNILFPTPIFPTTNGLALSLQKWSNIAIPSIRSGDNLTRGK